MTTRHIRTIIAVLISTLAMSQEASAQDTRRYELAGADEKLNATYRRLMARLDDNEKVVLRQAQRKWIEMRDLDCVLWPGDRRDCLIARTGMREEELREMLLISGR